MNRKSSIANRPSSLRVLFVVPRFWPEIGGVERHTAEVAAELVRRGHSLSIVTQRTQDRFPAREFHPQGFEIVRLRDRGLAGIPKTGFLLRPLVRSALKKIVAEVRPDIVHVHDIALWTRWWRPLLDRFRAKSFITFHGWEGRCPPDPRIIAARQLAAREALGCISAGAFIDKWYGTRSDEIVYGGVETATPPANGGGNARDTMAPLDRAVYVGRLAPDTGVESILDALAQLKTYAPALNIAGEGPLRDALAEKAAKYNLRVNFLPPVRQPAELFATHGIVFAGGYLSILEALAHGARVFAMFDNPLRRDYLTLFPRADVLAIAGNAAELAGKLSEVLDNPAQSDEIRRRGREWARTQTWSNVADAYERLWKNERS